MSVRQTAKSFGIPPWQLENPDRPPTEEETSVWFWRERYMQRLGL